MTFKDIMPVRRNLVAPLAHKATDMHTTETAAPAQAWPGAAAALIGTGLRGSSLHSATTAPPTPGTATSTTATRTTTTRAMRAVPWPSADPNLFGLLVQAWLDCRRTKRNSASALAFEACIESNLCALHAELASGTYQPGPSICFVVQRPRIREVWAAQFRDRVVHWLLYNHIAPRFHAAFVADSCACIPGRGTLYAAQRLEHQVRSVTVNWSRPAHYLKLDLANFFVSIDKGILFDRLAARIHEPFWRALASTILFHDPRTNVQVHGRPDLLARVPPHKSLFNAPQGTGLPIGNLSSQFFANVYLDALDQHIKHRLRAPYYVRYVDDMVLLHPSPLWLGTVLASITAWLPERLNARLNPAKTILQPASRGIDFVGHVVRPWRRTTRPRTLASALQRIEHLSAADVYASGNSTLGLVRQASHSHHEQALVCRALMKRGHAVDGDLTRVFKRRSAR